MLLEEEKQIVILFMYVTCKKNICRQFRGSSELKFHRLDKFFYHFLEMGEMYRKIFGDT